ncbi:MAG: hypothetical protein A2030_00190 [Chloroflexi bacterium RBG_19FT_COMBO_50_10]|nr:MAG: hypothetical protein A2030_00190 [Chloroflexi bacterium RBG_19FT_COMBO_50_10]
MLRIRTATAQVARKCFYDFILSWIGIVVEQRLSTHNKTWGAIATLQGMMFDVCINQWMVIGGNPFNSLDGLTITLDGKRHARKNRSAIEDDGAGSTCPSIAKHLGSSKAQPVMDDLVQHPFRLDIELISLLINGELDNALRQWKRFGRVFSNDMSFQ